MSGDCDDCDFNVCCCLCVMAANACGEQATLGGGATGAGRRGSMPEQATLEEPLRAQLPPLYIMERG